MNNLYAKKIGRENEWHLKINLFGLKNWLIQD